MEHRAYSQEALARILREPFVEGNSVQLLASGTRAFETIFEALRNARRFVCLEFYIIRSDETGLLLSKILRDKARQGIEVWLKYDHFGSLGTPVAYWRALEKAGVHVRAARPFRWTTPFRYTRRNHRKLIVIDGIQSFTGGLNIGDEYRGLLLRKSPWRDSGIMMSGPVSARLLERFKGSWAATGSDPVDVEAPAIDEAPRGDGASIVPVFTNSARERRRLRRLLYYSIQSARSNIFLTTAYFIPSMRLMEALEEAVLRGVDVRLLLPGESDFRAPFYAGRHFFDRLLRKGVRIFQYQGRILHAKTAVFDGVWSIIGSTNLDFRSLRRNDEGNVGVLDETIGREMRRIFEADLNDAVETTVESWSERPVSERIQERFFSLFRRRL